MNLMDHNRHRGNLSNFRNFRGSIAVFTVISAKLPVFTSNLVNNGIHNSSFIAARIVPITAAAELRSVCGGGKTMCYSPLRDTTASSTKSIIPHRGDVLVEIGMSVSWPQWAVNDLYSDLRLQSGFFQDDKMAMLLSGADKWSRV